MKKLTRSSILRYIAIFLIVVLAFCDGIAILSGIYTRKLGDRIDIEKIYNEIDQDEMVSQGSFVCLNNNDNIFYSNYQDMIPTYLGASYPHTNHGGVDFMIDKIRVIYYDKSSEEIFSEKFAYSDAYGKYICDEDAKYVLDVPKMKVGNYYVAFITDLEDNSFYVSDDYRISTVCNLVLKKDSWDAQQRLTSTDWAYMKASEQIDETLYIKEGFDAELYQTVVEPLGENYILFVTLISFIIALLALFVLTSAGHSKGSEEIHLTSWDNIGWAIHGIMMILLMFIVCIPFLFSRSPLYVLGNIKKTPQMLILSTLFALCTLFCGWFLETSIIRIKSKRFWQTTTVYHIYSTLRKPFGELLDRYRRYKDGLTGVGQIMHDTKAIINGEKTTVDVDKVDYPYQDFAADINTLAEGKTKAVDEMLKSERMRSELITNVSHDIKTPLTSIISYADLLSKKDFDDNDAKEYLSIISSQSTRLKTLLEDLIEASKASSGVLPVNLEELQIDILLTQILSEYEDRLSKKHLSVVTAIPETVLPVTTDGKHLSRVFCNLLSNVCKYSLEGTRVYVSLEQKGRTVVTIKNTSSEQLNISPEELKERFSRGDSSRTKEGSGLGLAITESLMELMGGSLDIDIDGDLFKVSITI